MNTFPIAKFIVIYYCFKWFCIAQEEAVAGSAESLVGKVYMYQALLIG